MRSAQPLGTLSSVQLIRLLGSTIVALSAMTACENGRSTLVVDVATELCPDVASGPRCIGPRFDTVTVSIDGEMRTERPVAVSDRFLDAVRIAEVDDLIPGTYTVLVQLLRDGVVVVRATRLVTLAGALHVIRVGFQGECAGVMCPVPDGDPIATECLGGSCVDPRCFDDMPPAGCDEICENDADCTPSVPCAQAQCFEGACIEAFDDAACPTGQRCVPERGCFDGALEGDPCTGDAACGTELICCGSVCRQPGCEDGNACTDDACTPEGCANTPNSDRCDDLVFCNGADICQDGACTLHGGSPCAATAVCDETTASCIGGALEGQPCTADPDCSAPLICCGAVCRQPGCNDGNGCTDDACTAGGCANTPNSAPCDDLVFCNGADTCGGGACTQHAGSPCGAMTVCDPATSSCVGCLADAHCPAPAEQPITGCAGFAGECGESGTQTFRITTYTCSGNTCVASMRDETRGCTMSRAGTPCGTGGMTCLGGICTCGGTLCVGSQYCLGGACWNYPTMEMIGYPDPSCVDGASGMQPGPFAGYRIYGRPGARIHKYNQRAYCGLPLMEAPETASTELYIPAGGVYVLELDNPAGPLSCSFQEYGRWEQYAVVDGLRVPPSGTIEQTWYNSQCPLVGGCINGYTWCP